ncbi:hypothetical protein [Streptomyces sp. SID8499]|uniref:hypothetical protein n=1 Tax=Streptomyces sp. SID8499 TaxID=2706106 RepID=UPI0013CB046E|nr:hypothetical protein [Streptomyces sp. SID8499]NED31088.1 hypothetical protein [Streptomyces sp. SID8499]
MTAPRTTAAEQLAAVRDAVEALPKPKPLTQEEYEEKRRRLEADAESARKALNRARAVYDRVCTDLTNLRYEWQEQQAADK